MDECNDGLNEEPIDQLQRCATCRMERACRYYGRDNVWLCLTGADKCWRRRKARSNKVKRSRR